MTALAFLQILFWLSAFGSVVWPLVSAEWTSWQNG